MGRASSRKILGSEVSSACGEPDPGAEQGKGIPKVTGSELNIDHRVLVVVLEYVKQGLRSRPGISQAERPRRSG